MGNNGVTLFTSAPGEIWLQLELNVVMREALMRFPDFGMLHLWKVPRTNAPTPTVLGDGGTFWLHWVTDCIWLF